MAYTNERIEKNKELIEEYDLDFDPYRIDRDEIRNAEDFNICAWHTRVTMVAYDEDRGLYLAYIEGDTRILEKTREEMGEYLAENYPKMEVTPYGERLDPRFERTEPL